MNFDIKPCYHCGIKDHFDVFDVFDASGIGITTGLIDRYLVRCYSCFMSGAIGNTRDKAISNWNFIYENNPPNSPTNLEQNTSHEPLGEEETKRLDSPVRVIIHSYRKRLCDSDGISAKAAIDGLVKAGILKDDSPKYVKEVAYRQYKSDEEKTVIDIESISNLRKKLEYQLSTLIPYPLEKEWIDEIVDIFGY